MTETNPEHAPLSLKDRDPGLGAVPAVGGPTIPARTWAWTIAAGLLAGLISWALGEPLCMAVLPRVTGTEMDGVKREFIALPDIAAADTRNATLCFAVLGGVLGAGLGAAGGLSRRSGRSAATAALLGLVVGAAASAGITMLILPPYFAYQMRTPDRDLQGLVLPLLVHIGLWAPAGAVGGWAFAHGLAPRGGTPVLVLGGLLGAAAGALVYEFAAGLAFPMAETNRVISESISARLLARVAVTTLAAAGVVLGLATTLPAGGERPSTPAE